MATVYLHIGYPKSFSTTLQRSYFEKHPKLHFGGVGIGNNISYANDSLELGFESLLKYANEHYWFKERNKVKQAIQNFISEAGSRKVVFSSEHFATKFTLQGISNEEKYDRIKYLTGEHRIKILVIKRKPVSFVRSMYGEYVKMGYDKAYPEFLKWIITFQDRNFLPDLNFKMKEDQLNSFFGSDNVDWLDFDSIKDKGVEKILNEKLTDWFDIDYHHMPITNDNPSLNLQEIASLVEWNKENPRGLGKDQTEPFARHRSRLIHVKSRIDYAEEEIFSEVLAKRKGLKWLEHKEKNRKINFDAATDLENQLLEEISSYSYAF
ncbi:hypothetical protein [Fodinibius salsisoli]|uniref:Sulfotransferase family protein n=1 Tax=Fodinibius salsisoli TaxID=2820877 RepID=A0ABT3PTE7_9BACT|nr:hypothetical protein [Fodinibius salsisoli]MCW9709131.1 hypothetical protein [Fodinibius salsisoli]